MRQIPASYGLVYFLDELEYTEAALAADPDGEELASDFEERIREWPGIFETERKSRRAVTRADAVVAVRNAQLDRTTTQFGLLAKAQDTSGAMLKRFFGATSTSRFIAQALAKQCERTLNLVVVEIDKLEKKHPLQALRTPLAKGAQAALDALGARNEAKGARQSTTNDVDDWKTGVNKLRTVAYAELLKIAADKGYATSWAETFFRTESTAAAEGDAPAGNAPPAAPPAAS